MRFLPLGVAVVAAALFFVGLGQAPFIDPPEGIHAAVADGMRRSGDWLTPRLDGVRYFDKPPLLYWLLGLSFSAAGPTPFAARLWPALAAAACAAVTARIGMVLAGARAGLLAGLMFATCLGTFVFARQVKPDMVFILFLTLGWAGFVLAYLGRGRPALALFYTSLALAALTKDIFGALAPIAVAGLFLWLTRERPFGIWFPWWGVLGFAALALPWFAAMEIANRGFLWYTIVDNHLLNFVRQRVFPDEDVPLGALEFLVVTAVAFLPWVLAVPHAVARTLREPRATSIPRLWLLLAAWAVGVIGFFTASAFRLPHYGLPAFPALALLAARTWDETIGEESGALGARALMTPVLVLFAALGAAFTAAWLGWVRLGDDALLAVDVAARNLAAHGQGVPAPPAAPFAPFFGAAAGIFAAGAAGLAFALYRRAAGPGVAVALATMVAFLPVAGNGMTAFAHARAARPLAELLASRVRPGDLVIHEGALENTASVLLILREPVRVVGGRQSNLAFGSTFPEARDIFWESGRVRETWESPRRCFLLSVVRADRSVVAGLPAGAVHLLGQAGGRRLYANRPD